MKFVCGLCSLQIFNAILLRFSRRLRNSPRPWVKHTQRPTTSDFLEKLHQKAKSSMSLQPHQNFIRYKSFTITFHILQFTVSIYYFPLFLICGNLDSCIAQSTWTIHKKYQST
jgi:hypothetical protein